MSIPFPGISIGTRPPVKWYPSPAPTTVVLPAKEKIVSPPRRSIVSIFGGTPEQVAQYIRDYELPRGPIDDIDVWDCPDGKILVTIIAFAPEESDDSHIS